MIFCVSPVDQAWLVAETNFTLGSYETFQPVFKDEKRKKTMGMSSGAKFEKQSKHVETKSYNLATLKAVSVQTNGMLMI